MCIMVIEFAKDITSLKEEVHTIDNNLIATVIDCILCTLERSGAYYVFDQ